ncbi:hypothetical protein G3I44_13595 [Halogeometricum borinquense]|uniref:Uncharacterized protein n=1 Tax=Halogeometricum borinquense TaxID=60847 RepID=A0A6C0UJ33_9EURY|nr:hypothetical protein [Halogeometricum borinquense]QIB75227.1 hypothetical protein G3I44_13595 [Halogeometricum borinquense]
MVKHPILTLLLAVLVGLMLGVPVLDMISQFLNDILSAVNIEFTVNL